MPIQAQPLPCDAAAFAPHLSTEAVERHRAAQQAGIDALNAMLGADGGDPAAPPDLAGLARESSGALAAHAAQAWAEDFYWSTLRRPNGDGVPEPRGPMADAVAQAFGDARRMRERFAEAAARLSGPGWVWLVQRPDGRLAILATPGAITPLTGTDTPLLACCLWPHAIPADQDDPRQRSLAALWALLDWHVVAARMRQPA